MHNPALNQHFLSSKADQNCDNMIEDDNLNKKKVSNPSLVKKRCIDNFETVMKKMVEVCGMSVVGIYHDPNVKLLSMFKH